MKYLRNGLKLQITNFVHGLATKSTNLQMINCPLSGRGQGHVMHFRISYPLKYLWNGYRYSRQILCDCRLYRVLAFGRPTIPQKGVAWVT